MYLKCIIVKLKAILFIFLIVAIAPSAVMAQQYSQSINKGASILTGSFSFTSQRGELYQIERARRSSLALNISYVYFPDQVFAIGFNSGVERIQNLDNKVTTVEIGPSYELYFGVNSVKLFFSLNTGYLYEREISNDERDDGFRLNLGMGLLVQKNHAGINLKGGIKYDNYGGGDTGTIRYVSVGVSGLFYKNEEK